ncbi:MAG: histidine kinase, partial [Verrucomicrobiales bacterium]|nr:histidine kinase [Verrucomicrobiales bacterium]
PRPDREFDSPPIRRIDKLGPPPLPPPEGRPPRPPMLGRMGPVKAQFNIPIYWLIVSVAHLIGYSARLRQREQQQALLLGELTQARLQALQTQLQPHFLFNTLNAISALIREQPRAAEEMVGNLSDLLRVTLDQKQEAETTLENELLVLGFYLDIQLARFGHRLRIEQNVPADVLDGLVPALILQPLVENAIEHGIRHSPNGVITLEARRVEDRLQIQVCDSGCGAPPDQLGKLPDGIGLGNTRTRLRTLYGANHRFELCRASSGGLCVELEIPFHLAPMVPTATPAGSQARLVE